MHLHLPALHLHLRQSARGKAAMSEPPALRRDHALVALKEAEVRLRALVLRECGDKAPAIWADFDRAIRAAREVILEL